MRVADLIQTVKTSRVAAIAAAVLFALALSAPAAAEVVASSGKRVAVATGEGVLLRLPAAAANIFVADPNIADIQVKSPRLVYVYGARSGNTSLYALGENDSVIYNARIAVSHDTAHVNAAIRDLMPGSDVRLRSVGGTLVLSGNVASPGEAEDLNRLAAELVGKAKVMNRVQIASPNQVNLRVKVAEVSRGIVKQLGFNWEAMVSSGDAVIGIATGREFVDTAIDEITGLPMREFLGAGGGQSSYFGNISTGDLDLSGMIDALDTDGLVSILAEPNLTAMSGESASFLAGGEFPIPVPQEGGTTTIEYKKYGVALAFTPTVIDGRRINLKVNPEVSQLSSAGALVSDGFSIPSLTTRRTETTVELASGQSFAIAGLLQNTLGRDLSKMPGLGDIPILGALFRSDSYRRDETELVIIVTPYIVRPVNSPDMALPTDGLEMPNDYERLVEGQAYRPKPLEDAPADTGRSGMELVGPGGFVLN